MKVERSLASLSCLLLMVAAVAMGSAWRVQDMATEKLTEAKRVQDRTVPEASAAPPSPKVNRKILDNLATAKQVRTDIDASLREIGLSVTGLRGRLGDSEQIALSTRKTIRALATAMAASSGPASVTARELHDAVVTLRDSGRLGRAILRELRELDRKTGTALP